MSADPRYNDPIESLMRGMEDGTLAEYYRDLYHQNAIIDLPGDTHVSGRYVGVNKYWDHTFRIVTSAFKVDGPGLDGFKYMKKRRLACRDDSTAVWLVQGSIPTKNGLSYNQNYAFVARASGGKMDYTCELLDTDIIETAVLDNPHRVKRAQPANPFSVDLGDVPRSTTGSRKKTLEIVESWLESIRAYDLDAYVRLLHPDVVVNIVGTTPYSGRWIGRNAFLQTNFDFHGHMFRAGTREIGRFYHVYCADQGGFCLVMKGRAVTLGGNQYEPTYGVVGQVSEGTITDLFIYPDTAHAEDRLFDNSFMKPRKASPITEFSIY